MKEVFQLSRGTDGKAALEMANIQSFYYFSGGGRIAFSLYQMVSSRNNWKDWYLVKISLPLATSYADLVW